MLAYSFYDTDNRIRRYAETLVKQGYKNFLWYEGDDALYLTSSFRNFWKHSAHDTNTNINFKQAEAIPSGLQLAIMLFSKK